MKDAIVLQRAPHKLANKLKAYDARRTDFDARVADGRLDADSKRALSRIDTDQRFRDRAVKEAAQPFLMLVGLSKPKAFAKLLKEHQENNPPTGHVFQDAIDAINKAFMTSDMHMSSLSTLANKVEKLSDEEALQYTIILLDGNPTSDWDYNVEQFIALTGSLSHLRRCSATEFEKKMNQLADTFFITEMSLYREISREIYGVVPENYNLTGNGGANYDPILAARVAKQMREARMNN